jgi:hypothetical protein
MSAVQLTTFLTHYEKEYIEKFKGNPSIPELGVATTNEKIDLLCKLHWGQGGVLNAPGQIQQIIANKNIAYLDEKTKALLSYKKLLVRTLERYQTEVGAAMDPSIPALVQKKIDFCNAGTFQGGVLKGLVESLRASFRAKQIFEAQPPKVLSEKGVKNNLAVVGQILTYFQVTLPAGAEGAIPPSLSAHLNQLIAHWQGYKNQFEALLPPAQAAAAEAGEALSTESAPEAAASAAGPKPVYATPMLEASCVERKSDQSSSLEMTLE